MRGWGVMGLFILVLVLVLALAGCGGSGSQSAPGGLVLERSGLLASVPFTAPQSSSSLLRSFRLGGTAGPSDASVHALAGGLAVDVGLPRRRSGRWAGYFAATAATYPAGAVFHVSMWRLSPARPFTSQTGISLFAVQTGEYNALNYVLVAGVVTRRSAFWAVGHAIGNLAYARTKILWITRSADTRQSVTLQTDGRGRYTVYFGNRLVYQSRALRLMITPPFRAYLEVEAHRAAYRTRFQDLWVAVSDTVTLVGLGPGEHVTLAPSGGAPVRALADAGGQARLTLPLYEAVGSGTLTVDGVGGRRRFAGLAFAGGDVYRVKP